VTISSIDGKFERTMDATCMENPLGNLPLVDWNVQKQQWDHLRSINFPELNPGPALVIIGVDQPDLVASLADIEAPSPSMPTARLTRLGWCAAGPCSCINP